MNEQRCCACKRPVTEADSLVYGWPGERICETCMDSLLEALI